MPGRGPIPAIAALPGLFGDPRGYIRATGSGCLDKRGYKAHYADIDLYGTFNLHKNVGAQIGWRSLDVGYLIEDDYGNFDVRGLYFGVVARY